MCLEKGMRSQRGCTVQGFSPLDLLPADLRAAKNPKRRKRRRKRTRRRRNIRRRRRRTSIPRRILPLHPPILPQIGIRGNWDGMGHHQWKTGATCTRPPSERTAGISHFPKSLFHRQNHLVPAGSSAGKRSSTRRHRGTGAGGGGTRNPRRAAAAAPAVHAAGAGTAAAITRPHGERAGREAGPAPPRPAGSGSATTPTRRTEREPGGCFRVILQGFFLFFKVMK